MIAIEVSKAPDKFKCSDCRARHCDLDGEMPGSIGPAAFNIYEIPGVIASNVCLLPMVTAFSRECLRLYGHYKNSVFPFSGGVYEQPRRYMQAMELIDANVKS
jgi:hypothetical protein